MKRKMCLRMFPLVNEVNTRKECSTLITLLSISPACECMVHLPLPASPSLPPAVCCDTVCDNTNTSFCHCRLLTGSLDCLVIQLKQ